MRINSSLLRASKFNRAVSLAATAVASAIFAQHAKGVTLNQYYFDVSIYSDAGLTNLVSSIVINQSNPVVNLPIGDYLSFGVSDVVTNNPNPAAGDTSGKAPNNQAQPANLGLAEIGYTFLSSDPNALNLAPNLSGQPRVTLECGRVLEYSTARILANSNIMPVQDPGDEEQGSGSVGQYFQIAALEEGSGSTLRSGSEMGVQELTQYLPTSGPTASPATATALFEDLSYQGFNTGTVTLTPTLDFADYWKNTAIGTGTTQSSYAETNFGSADTIAPLPALVVNIGGPALPIHPILSLSSTPPGTNYGAQILQTIQFPDTNCGVPNETYSLPNLLYLGIGFNNLSQVTAVRNGQGSTIGPTTDYIEATGLITAPQDREIFALAVSATASQLAQLAEDINSSNAYGFGSAIASTSLATDPFPSMYNLFLTFPYGIPGLAATEYLGFDFTQDPNVSGATVTAIAVTAVPEPMTFGTLVLGAVGGLLVRRRQRIA